MENQPMLNETLENQISDILYRYYMTEFSLEKLNIKKMTRNELRKQLFSLGFKVNLRQPENYNRIEVSTLDESQFFEVEI
tara:strand:- start:369 stop:608 length:240 start_codon:yes stop_codon:yes gene_type:complete